MDASPDFIDSESLRRIKTAPIDRAGKYMEVMLDRDRYMDEAAILGGETVKLKPEFQEAAIRCGRAGLARIRLNGCNNDAQTDANNLWVRLVVPHPLVNEAVEALRVAELDGDLGPLAALTAKLAVPADAWLAFGERSLQKGVDFFCSPKKFAQLVKWEADSRRDRRVECRISGEVVSVAVMPETDRERRLRDLKRGRR